MTDPSSFYVGGGEVGRFVATELTRGPWSDAHQHGGPPSALLARAFDAAGPEASAWLVSRLTVELLRPIPIGPVRVDAAPTREGGKAQWWHGTLRDDAGEVLARATATRIRRAPIELESPRHPLPDPLPAPDDSEPVVFPFFRTRLGYHTAVEVRIARGRWGHGPAAGWLRSRVPLVEGEDTPPISRVVIAADAANGVAYVLDARRWAFVNPDLTVTCWRSHEGEWVGLDTFAVADAGGTGLVEAQLHDERGAMGRSAQTLVVRPH